MNVHESEKLAAICEKIGYVLGENKEDADLIIFNTCAIREGAETPKHCQTQHSQLNFMTVKTNQ
mgnify:CR=1 FL=1